MTLRLHSKDTLFAKSAGGLGECTGQLLTTHAWIVESVSISDGEKCA